MSGHRLTAERLGRDRDDRGRTRRHNWNGPGRFRRSRDGVGGGQDWGRLVGGGLVDGYRGLLRGAEDEVDQGHEGERRYRREEPPGGARLGDGELRSQGQGGGGDEQHEGVADRGAGGAAAADGEERG